MINASLERPGFAERKQLRKSCREVDRHALTQPDPGEPGDRLVCRKVAEQLRKTCRKVTPGAEIQPNICQTRRVGPKLNSVGPNLDQFSRVATRLRRGLPKFGWFGLSLVNIDRHCSNSALCGLSCPHRPHNLTEFAQFRSTLAKLWQISAKFGRY